MIPSAHSSFALECSRPRILLKGLSDTWNMVNELVLLLTEWEHFKENFQPLARGRRAAEINSTRGQRTRRQQNKTHVPEGEATDAAAEGGVAGATSNSNFAPAGCFDIHADLSYAEDVVESQK